MTLPPLRERRDDIALLVEHFVQKFARQQGKVIDTIPGDIRNALEQYSWPGNIRELQNVIERGVIMTTGTILSRHTTEHLTLHEVGPVGGLEIMEPASTKSLADAERAHITGILRETNWVVGGAHGAAAVLGLPRTTLIARMQRLGISGVTPRSRSAQPPRRLSQVMEDLSSRLTEGPPVGLGAMEAAAS